MNVSNGDLNWIANYIWGIADDVLRDLYVRGKYRDVVLPMAVLRRLDAVLEDGKQAVLDMKTALDEPAWWSKTPPPVKRLGKPSTTPPGSPGPQRWRLRAVLFLSAVRHALRDLQGQSSEARVSWRPRSHRASGSREWTPRP